MSVYLTCTPPPEGRTSAGSTRRQGGGLAQEGAQEGPGHRGRSSRKETPQTTQPMGFSPEHRDSTGSSSMHPGDVVERNEETFLIVILGKNLGFSFNLLRLPEWEIQIK